MKDLFTLAENTANRLKLIQSEFTADNSDQRATYIEEEICRSLEQVDNAQREDYLELLTSRFPVLEFGVPKSLDPEFTPEADDPETIFLRLLETIPDLSEDEKKSFCERLESVGLKFTAEPETEDSKADDNHLKNRLKVDHIDQNNKNELLLMLIDVMIHLDLGTRKICQELQKKVNVKNPPPIPFGNLNNLITKFINNSGKISEKDVDSAVNNILKIIAMILISIPEVPVQYQTNHLSKIAPDEIERTVQRGDIFARKEGRCWNKYTSLYQSENIELFPQKMQEYYGDFINIALSEIARKKQ